MVIHSCLLFLLEYENINGLLTFCKNYISVKIWFLSYGPKTSETIRMKQNKEFFKLQYLTNELRYKV